MRPTSLLFCRCQLSTVYPCQKSGERETAMETSHKTWRVGWLSLSLWALHVVRSEATRHRPATGLEKPGQLRRSAGTAVDSLSNTKSQSIWVNMGQLSNRISEKPVLATISNHFPGLLSFAACLANSPPFSGTLDAGRIWETRPDLIKTYQNHSGNEQLLVISIWILRSWSRHWSHISLISLTFWIVRLFRFAGPFIGRRTSKVTFQRCAWWPNKFPLVHFVPALPPQNSTFAVEMDHCCQA